MTAAPSRARLVGLGRSEFADRLGEAIDVYVTAMGYPRSTARQRRSLWLEHSYRPGWRSVGWLDEQDRLTGIGYGYWGGPGQWWFEEVRRGLRARRGEPDAVSADWLTDYFELTELHVHPQAQGSGIGEALLRALARDAARSRMLLSTPSTAAPGPAGPGGSTVAPGSSTCCASTCSPATRVLRRPRARASPAPHGSPDTRPE